MKPASCSDTPARCRRPPPNCGTGLPDRCKQNEVRDGVGWRGPPCSFFRPCDHYRDLMPIEDGRGAWGKPLGVPMGYAAPPASCRRGAS